MAKTPLALIALLAPVLTAAVVAERHEQTSSPEGVQPPATAGQPSDCVAINVPKDPLQPTVRLYVIISATGVPKGVKVIKSAGKERDAQAVLVVRKSRFRPAMKNNVPVEVDLYLDVVFSC